MRTLGHSGESRSSASGAAADPRRQYQLDMLDLWLGAFAGGYVHAKSEIEEGKQTRKASSRVPMNLLWFQACLDPAVQETTQVLEHLVLNRMQHEKPMTFWLFEYLYLREHANPSEMEAWRFRSARTLSIQERAERKGEKGVPKRELDTARRDLLRLKMLAKGKNWICDEAAREHELYTFSVPDPIDPLNYVKQSVKSQRIAQRVYWQNVDQFGDSKARSKAARASGYSLRHLRRIISPSSQREEVAS